jgi:hypothetical protein
MTPSRGLLRLRAPSWSVLLLLAGWAAAGAGGHGIPRHGLALHGASPPDRSPTAGHSASAAPGVTPPSTPRPAAGSLIPRALANPALASTAAKRDHLSYLVRCALPEHIRVYAEYGGERFTFQGSLGLAPRWLDAALTLSEERWVSACLLAHVNYFGKHVLVSMRAIPPPVPALEASHDEQQTFAIFEGGFFGNLFLPEPVAYTCPGERTPTQANDPILQDRVCTQETGATTGEGTPVTLCDFLVTGRCEDSTSFTVKGMYYSEVIFVYLKSSKQ